MITRERKPFRVLAPERGLLPANGGQGCFITVQQFREVVVRQARCWAV